MKTPRNRILRHVHVRAGELIPHELNPRVHPEAQKAALAALYDEIGFARSLLAYELPDGRLKLIDGHLRAAMDPEQILDVEVLDVNDAEARALLLAIDPLAQLAEYDAETLTALRTVAEQDSRAVRQLWDTLTAASEQTAATLNKSGSSRNIPPAPEQFLVLVECASEEDQTALLARFQAEGLKCKPLLS